MTQFCIVEAINVAYDAQLNSELEADQPAAKPGEITDPVMQDAMEKAKQMHAERFGVRV